ncbi:MAG: Gfo/Idh/MocA family oxidoreductase [Victivallales bacterium]|nr:Gfo/Idh/MocA family oxidoreductase [Victivallales bacterium]
MSKKLKVGIWGLGRAGNKMHAVELRKYENLYEIVAGLDTAEDRRSAFTEQYECEVFSDEEAFLADDSIDLISIATRSKDHTPHAIRALATGKFVFLEKPIALTYAEALELKKAAEKHPGKLYLRHNRRFEPAFLHIREIIASGILGDVFEVKLRRHGFQRRADWQTLSACGGGQLNNWGPHIIDHALRFINTPVKDIWSDLKRIAAVGDAEDHLKIILKGENGMIVDLEISGGAAIPEDEYIIFGSKGALTCKGDEIELKYIDPKQSFQDISAEPGNPPLKGGFANDEPIKWIEETVKVAPSSGLDTHSIWPEMHDSIVNGSQFRISIDEAVEVVRITEKVKKRHQAESAK